MAQAQTITVLWPYINQLEEVLDVMNAGFVEYFENCGGTKERGWATINSMHNLLGVTQTVADALARAAAVRYRLCVPRQHHVPDLARVIYYNQLADGRIVLLLIASSSTPMGWWSILSRPSSRHRFFSQKMRAAASGGRVRDTARARRDAPGCRDLEASARTDGGLGLGGRISGAAAPMAQQGHRKIFATH